MKKAVGLTLATAAALGWGLLATPAGFAQQEGAQERGENAQNAEQSSHKGEFAEADDGELTMTVDGDNEHKHQVTERTRVTINGKAAKLQDLKKGDKIEVTINDENEALIIQATRRDRPDARETRRDRTASSIHQEEFLEAGDGEFTVIIDGEKHKHKVNEQTRVTIDGEAARLRDLKKGDKIEVTINDENEALTIQATRRERPDARETRRQQRDGRAPRREQRDAREDAPRRAASQPPALGIRIGESRTTGVLVREVRRGGPAAQAGMRSGDYILTINGEKVGSPDDFDQLMQDVRPNDTAELIVWRNGERVTLQASFDERSAARFPPEGERQAGSDGDEGDAWLGVLLRESGQEGRGVRIDRVYPGSPAARSGLRSGDVLIRVADTEVSEPDAAADVISQAKPNEELELTVLRDGQETEVTAVLADRSRIFSRGSSPNRGEEGFDPDDAIDEHTMMLEQNRRFAEQHERMENLLHEVLDQVEALRKEVQQLRGARPGAAPERAPADAPERDE